jgi:hypothetical protein
MKGKATIFSVAFLAVVTAGLYFVATHDPIQQQQRYQQLTKRWDMAVRGNRSTDGQQRRGISKAIWFGDASARRQMLLEAESGQFQIDKGRLIEQLVGVQGVWQERFLGEQAQLIEEFRSPLAHYDYGRQQLQAGDVQINRWKASGRRLNLKDQTRTPLMDAVAEGITVHLESPPHLEAHTLKAKVFPDRS